MNNHRTTTTMNNNIDARQLAQEIVVWYKNRCLCRNNSSIIMNHTTTATDDAADSLATATTMAVGNPNPSSTMDTTTNTIQHYLRPCLTRMTQQILSSSSSKSTTTTKQPPPSYLPHQPTNNIDSAAIITTTNHNNNENNHTNTATGDAAFQWHEFLAALTIDDTTTSSSSSSSSNSLIDSSSSSSSSRHRYQTSSQARLDAFFEGLALAVRTTSSSALLLSSSTNTTKLQPQQSGSRRFVDRNSTNQWSLTDGLVGGFQSLMQWGGGGGNTTSTSNLQTSPSPTTLTTTTTTSPVAVVTQQQQQQLQMNDSELLIRIELYIRSVCRVVSYQSDCVIPYEPHRALRARTNYTITAFVRTVGTVRHVHPIVTQLLVAMTKELLAVTTLSESLLRIIRTIGSNYIHATSFASLAFLSSPQSSADQLLSPAIYQYLLYLQANYQACIRDCDIEYMLSTVIEPQLRNLYKTTEFQSIGHVLEVYQSHKYLLQNIVLPPSPVLVEGKSDEQQQQHTIVRDQALKDIPREVIAVNGSVLPRVTNQSDLIQLLTSALHIRPLYTNAMADDDHDEETTGTSTNHRRRRRHRRENKKKKAQQQQPSGSGNEADIDSNQNNKNISNVLGDESSMDEYYTTDTDGQQTDDTTGSTPVLVVARRKNASIPQPQQLNKQFPTTATTTTTTTAMVDLLSDRLLLAISRSGTMGDAYFVVRDLFGGDDLEVVPSSSLSPQYHHHHRPTTTTIDLFVRLTSITIKTYASFDVYPKSMIGDCEPLIQIHTTTTETIALHEIRATDTETTTTTTTKLVGTTNASDNSSPPPSLAMENTASGTSDRILQEMITETTGYRYLSIRPALYEKVSEWHTPS